MYVALEWADRAMVGPDPISSCASSLVGKPTLPTSVWAIRMGKVGGGAPGSKNGDIHGGTVGRGEVTATN